MLLKAAKQDLETINRLDTKKVQTVKRLIYLYVKRTTARMPSIQS